MPSSRPASNRVSESKLQLAWRALFSPCNAFGPDRPNPRASVPPDNLEQLDHWLATSEAAYPDLRPGTAKTIVWHGAEKRRTPLSLVYVHGFSASRLETAPLADRTAEALGANLFYTRLTGHGLPAAAMATATLQDWFADITEAVRIGQQLGERVILIGCSTGASLATWLALRAEGSAVAAHVFLSPNFGPKDKRANLINWPWGRYLVQWIQGTFRSAPTVDPRESIAWTNPYATQALFPVMALVKRIRKSDLSRFTTPVLMLFSVADQTVDAQATRDAFQRMGSPLKTLELVSYSRARGQHVLAGDIMAPDATAPMSDFIVDWVHKLPASRS